jgi:hypothetical protein
LNIFRLNLFISILKNIFNHLFKIILITTYSIEENIEILKHLSWWDYRILLILNQHIFTIIRIFFNDLSWLIFNLILKLDLIIRFCNLNFTVAYCKSIGDFLFLRKCFFVEVYYLESWFKFGDLLNTFIFVHHTFELKANFLSIFRNASINKNDVTR